MHRETAIKILGFMTHANKNLNEALHTIKNECSEDVFLKNRDEVGKIMLDIYLNVMRPIHDQHPDLEPEDIKQSRLPKSDI